MTQQMSRITVAVDKHLIEEARLALCVSTKREAIELALRAAVKTRRRSEALSRTARLNLELDQEALPELRRQS